MSKPWSVLGINETSDKKQIKKAYAVRLKKCRPDENPKAFQELHEAYQAALEWAAEAGPSAGNSGNTPASARGKGSGSELTEEKQQLIGGLIAAFEESWRKGEYLKAVDDLTAKVSEDNLCMEANIVRHLNASLVTSIAAMKNFQPALRKLYQDLQWRSFWLFNKDLIRRDSRFRSFTRIVTYCIDEQRKLLKMPWYHFQENLKTQSGHQALSALHEEITPIFQNEPECKPIFQIMIVEAVMEGIMPPEVLMQLVQTYQIEDPQKILPMEQQPSKEKFHEKLEGLKERFHRNRFEAEWEKKTRIRRWFRRLFTAPSPWLTRRIVIYGNILFFLFVVPFIARGPQPRRWPSEDKAVTYPLPVTSSLFEYDPMSYLFNAVQTGNLGAATLYLKYGADPNIVVDSKETFLQIAVRRNDIKMVRLLLEMGALVDPISNDKYNAFKTAQKLRNKEMVRLLSEAYDRERFNNVRHQQK